MGAAATVECTYDSSSYGHAGLATAGGNSGPAFLRRRSLSLASSSSSSDSRRPSGNNSVPTATLETPQFEVVRPHVLSVPVYERHPFSDYKFNKKVGEGSFATVFKGVSIHDDRLKVAVKEINVRTLGKQQLHDLNMEMNILSQLHHNSIVKIHAVYSTPDKTFMITEYLPGGELLSAICKRDHYHERDARRVMYQVTSALLYMHSRRVIHRDIKPMNLILADRSLDSAIKIADFGFATIDTEEIRRPGRFLCGTPGYIAPEVLKYRCYSPKVDTWSLGIVMYVLLSGYMPFPTDEAGEEHVKRGRVVFPPARFARVSHQAKDLILKLLTVDPDSRYSASQVLQHPWLLEYAQQQCHQEKQQQQQQQQQQLLEKAVPRRNSNSSVSSTASTCTFTTDQHTGSHKQHIFKTLSLPDASSLPADHYDVGEEHMMVAVRNERMNSNDSGASSAAYASQQPPNSLTNHDAMGEEESDFDPYEAYAQNRQARGVCKEEEECPNEEEEEDGDLSENLEWIRLYHASEQHPQTFTGRLWRSIRTGISPTSVANHPNTVSSSSSKRDHPQASVVPSGSSSSYSNFAGRKQQQHQDILMALSERELQRQYEEYQERQTQQRQIQHHMHRNATETSVNNTSQRKFSKGKLSELPAIPAKSMDAAPIREPAGLGDRSNSSASLRPPSDVGQESATLSTAISDNNSLNDSKSHQLVTPRLLPPILSSIITGTSSSNLLGTAALHHTQEYQEYSSVNHHNNNNPSKLPRSAQKYGSGKIGPTGGSNGNGNYGHESMFHPPTTLLAYSR